MERETKIYRQLRNDLNRRAEKAGSEGTLSYTDLFAVAEYYNEHCLVPNCTHEDYQFDHVIPLESKGENHRRNLQLLCESHNKARQAIDYRPLNKPFCPDDFIPSNLPDWVIEYELRKEQKTNLNRNYKKHDYNALRFEYETENISLRELADKHNIFYTLLLKRSASEGWVKGKKEFGIELVSDVEKETRKLAVEKEVNARGLLFDVIEVAVQEWANKPKATASELAQLLKLGLAAQGETTERTQTNVSEHEDDASILARIHQAFDAGEEERTYSPVGLGGEEQSAGWSD